MSGLNGIFSLGHAIVVGVIKFVERLLLIWFPKTPLKADPLQYGSCAGVVKRRFKVSLDMGNMGDTPIEFI